MLISIKPLPKIITRFWNRHKKHFPSGAPFPPKRGEIVRQIGLRLRYYKLPLGTLIAYETGKSLQEGLGEVQVVIDICDYCVDQSRMLYGMTTVSERPGHRLFDQYHPLGVVAIITTFNFPMAV